jgi:hypothetical protein
MAALIGPANWGHAARRLASSGSVRRVDSCFTGASRGASGPALCSEVFAGKGLQLPVGALLISGLQVRVLQGAVLTLDRN